MRFKLFLWFIAIFLPYVVFASTPSKDALIRDAEIEDVLKSYVEPIFKVAKLDPKSLHLYIINSKDVNAFAMTGGCIAINTGLILKANSALQVIGVLAHETAHIADRHIMRGIDAYEKALQQNLLGILGGVIATAAGRPDAGTAIMMGAQGIAEKGFLKFSRTQEGSADQGAVRFLDSLGYSSRGALEFMEILRKDDLLSEQFLDPYVLTHPLVSERLDFLRTHLSKSPHANAKLPKGFEENFKRIQAKIAAFTQSPAKTFAQFEPTDTSLLARYARSIAYFQSSQIPEALHEVDALLTEYPQDAFFWDLKGQILFESGKIKEATHAFEKAVQFRPDIPLLRVNLAHALLESEDSSKLKVAFKELTRARMEEQDNPFTHRLLAVYYGKSGNTGLAALSLAEMAFEVGDYKTAEQQAKRSLHFLKSDSLNETRAKAILSEIKEIKDRESWLF